MLAWDIETDGLLHQMTHVKCINVVDVRTRQEYRFTDHKYYEDVLTGDLTSERTLRDGTIADGLQMLSEAEGHTGQNIIGFDIPALRQLFPKWDIRPDARLVDTKIYSQLMYPDLKERDFARLRKGKLPPEFERKGLVGTHKLESWLIRLGGRLKGEFKPADMLRQMPDGSLAKWSWTEYPFSKQCDDYCMDDVRGSVDLYDFFTAKPYSEEALRTEHIVAGIVGRQERYGFMFDVKAAEALVPELLTRKVELEEQLKGTFGCWYVPSGKPKTAQRGNKKRGIEKGVEYQNIKLCEFNPASRDHIANRMRKLFGWQPEEFTPSGKAKVDETTLEGLPFPEAKLCVEYLTVDKRLGQLAEGKQAWLKKVQADGRMRGSVNTLGTVTGRMTHSHPNVAQVPRVGSYLGAECRALFIVPPGQKLVGCDAEGLELRCLAHYMNEVEYTEAVVNGDKAKGTDVHTVNQGILQLRKRDNAKTWIYAFLYGAGDYKLGTIVVDDFDDEKKARFFAKYPPGRKRDAAIVRLGKRSRDRIAEGLPALGKMASRVKQAARRGYLKGIDGRHLLVRSQHSALNTLLQGAGAIVMKVALVLMDDELKARGYIPGIDYEFVANVHDEVQLEVDEAIADDVGQIASRAISAAGERLGFRCPLAGDYAVGDCWRDTH